jgi:dUTPase
MAAPTVFMDAGDAAAMSPSDAGAVDAGAADNAETMSADDMADIVSIRSLRAVAKSAPAEAAADDDDAPHFFIQPGPTAIGLYSDIVEPGGVRGDSGTDLRFPAGKSFLTFASQMDYSSVTVVDLDVRVRCMLRGKFVPYMITPRSSIAKTNLSMANSVGIIDSGYCGNLKVPIRAHADCHDTVSRGDSLFQLVRPDLSPARVSVVGPDHPAFAPTVRGDGGFGSTGRTGA